MKIAMLYGPFSTANRLFDLRNNKIYGDSRGMTGSETSFFTIARELKLLGHDVSIFAPVIDECIGYGWDGIRVDKYQHIRAVVDSSWHAAYAWNEADLLRDLDWHVIRLCNLQLNDFMHCRSDCDNFVDVWTSPSESHRQVIGSKSWNPKKWFVITNGCDPTLYDISQKIDGRVIWASSPDRGLHWLLQMWPSIKREVPHANLKIFYKLKPWLDHFTSVSVNANPTYPELVSRAFYIKESLQRLKNHDIEVCDSVSRLQMIKEMNEAQVLAYSCDTVSYTEGFSVTTMEACASGTVPVICGVDALSSIYGGHVPTVDPPMSANKEVYKNIVVKALIDSKFRFECVEKSLSLSKDYNWKSITKNVESLIVDQRTQRGWSCL